MRPEDVAHHANEFARTRSHASENFLLAFERDANALTIARDVVRDRAAYGDDAAFAAARGIKGRIVANIRESENDGSIDGVIEILARMAYDDAKDARVVRMKLIECVAIAVKRACVEGRNVEDMDRAIARASRGRALGNDDADAMRIECEIYAALAHEFAPGTATAIGVSWEAHERVRGMAEKRALRGMYECGARAAGAAAARCGDGSDRGVCVAGLEVMNAVLNWDFSRDVSYGFRGRAFPSTESAANAFVRLTPGMEWREILLSPGALDWLYALHATAENAVLGGGGIEAKRVAAASRKTLSALCSLSGCVFPSKDADDGLRVGHFARCARAIASYLLPASKSVNAAIEGYGEDALMDGCRSIYALAMVHEAQDFASVSLGADLNVTALDVLGELTLECLNRGALSVDAESTVVDECLKMLLECWGALVNKGMFVPGASVEATPAAILEGASKISHAYVHAGLKAAREGAHEEDDGHEEEGKAGARALDARLELAAQVLRAHPTTTLPLLEHILVSKCSALPACVVSGRDPSEVLEELWWTTRLVGHVLADDGDGETPIPPDSLAAASAAATSGGPNCVFDLARALINTGCLTFDVHARGALSARLVETMIWSLARWADTYLMPEDSGGNLHAAIYAATGGVRRGTEIANKLAQDGGGMFSEARDGREALDALVQIGTAALSHWPGETSLQKTAGFVLFPALTRRKALCKHLLTIPSWTALANAAAGAQRERGVVAFPPEVHRGLSESIGRLASVIDDKAACEAYITRLIAPAGEVLALVSVDSAGLHHPEGEARACAALEALRGAVRATNGHSQATIFNFFVGAMEHLLTLQDSAKDLARVTKLLLRLSEELVEMNSPYLNAQQVNWICCYCLRIIETYTKSGRGNVKSNTGAWLSQEAVKEAYKEVRALLKMLTHLSSGNLHDAIIESAPANEATAAAAKMDIAHVVFAGLNTVIPLISAELLQFPKLCKQYFELLAFMLEAYPKKVAQLDCGMFSTLMSTLEFGLKHADETVSKESMTALGALATFQCNSAKAGDQGLGIHMAHNAQGLTILGHLMRLLFQRLVFEEAVFDLVDEAADALLPIIVYERQAYEALAQTLIASVGDDARARELLSNAFVRLTSANGLTEGVDRTNKRRFRRNLCEFLTVARGVVRQQ